MDQATIEQMLNLIPIIIFCLAGLIVAIVGTVAFVVARRPQAGGAGPVAEAVTAGATSEAEAAALGTPPLASDLKPEEFLAEQQESLQDFEVADLSLAFRGVTGQGYRQGTIVHHSRSDVPLIAFVTQTTGGQMGLIKASTVYGDMDLTVTSGRADLDWNGDRLGTLDYRNQRILGSEGQLLGEISRPAHAATLTPEDQHYPLSFFGQKVGELHFNVEGLGSLRWFTEADEGTHDPAYTELQPELSDAQKIFMMAALVMEVGFFDYLRSLQ